MHCKFYSLRCCFLFVFCLYRGIWISQQCFPSVWCKCSLTDTTVQCGKASPQLSALKLRNYDNRSSRQHQQAHLLWWWMAPCHTMNCNGAIISKRVTPAASSRILKDKKRQTWQWFVFICHITDIFSYLISFYKPLGVQNTFFQFHCLNNFLWGVSLQFSIDFFT